MQGQQNSRSEYRVGPGASSLLLIFVSVCLTTIGILTLISAITDTRLSERSNVYVTSYYEAAARAQREIGVIDGQLLDARKQAAGDVEAYASLVEALVGNQVPMTVNRVDDEGMSIIVFVPMNDDNHVEVELYVPLDFDSPRYELVRHVTVNTAEWLPEADLELFGIFEEGIDFTGEDEEDDVDMEIIFSDDVDDEEPMSDDEVGIVGEGTSVLISDEGE